MSAENEVHRLLREHGVVLIRSNRHAVYRFPDGRCFTTPRTPSCRRAYDNLLTDLRHFLGLERQIHKNRDRKSKPGVAGHAAIIYAPTDRKIGWRTQLNQAMSAIEQERARERGGR